jgi:hypothetical protein
LAAHVATSAQTASVRRRFYRFFQHVELDGTAAARIVVDLLGIKGRPWVLAMDRTNWDFGRTPINILMVSVIWNGVGIPLIWTLLPTAGNSNSETRACLLDRLHQVFPDLRIAALTGDREFLALAASAKPRRALARYRRRWTIETLFGNLKTKGFNLEDTHITDHGKLSTLLAVLAMAVALGVKTGVAAARLKSIPIKNHGRKAVSLFALGLHALRKIFAAGTPEQVIVFLKQLISPKIPFNPLKSFAL